MVEGNFPVTQMHLYRIYVLGMRLDNWNLMWRVSTVINSGWCDDSCGKVLKTRNRHTDSCLRPCCTGNLHWKWWVSISVTLEYTYAPRYEHIVYGWMGRYLSRIRILECPLTLRWNCLLCTKWCRLHLSAITMHELLVMCSGSYIKVFCSQKSWPVWKIAVQYMHPNPEYHSIPYNYCSLIEAHM